MSIRIFALCTTLLAFGAPAGAQQINGWMNQHSSSYADDYQWSYNDSRRIAYDNGYREGRRDGDDAARDRKPFDLEREKDFRNADRGYSRNYGDKERYRESFRRGYSAGYREAYDRYGYNGGYYGGQATPRRDNGYGYPAPYPTTPYPSSRYPNRYPEYGGGYQSNVAFQNGAHDGYDKGIDDARHGRYPDYARQKWYRSGDHDYNSRYGSKEFYREQYRRGFQEGYDRAYRETRRW
jgi:hypothetical protein